MSTAKISKASSSKRRHDREEKKGRKEKEGDDDESRDSENAKSEEITDVGKFTNPRKDLKIDFKIYFTVFHGFVDTKKENNRFGRWPILVWLYNIGLDSLVYPVEKVCDDSGEDPSCSRSVTGNSISDHLTYFGVELQAETWRSCRIVMDRLVVNYGVRDFGGNLVLSRDSTASLLEVNTHLGGSGSSFL
ncbi:hypothetical protein GIB67_006929 [Kingdonia uniflora]|uniref:Uncharacterized protein n=1 Tax=Kingdonia uniflora TaxID=39325 RepID=A0A7J7L0C0_9MAGN|nr:hypothetical protein GIB67_006929 [Kingdonia uniflora]